MVTNNDRLLARAAARAEDDRFFVGSALAAYRRLRGIDGTALAAELGCEEPALSRLALCRRPEGEGPMFRDEVTRIADYTGCDVARLASVLRAATTAERMRTPAPATLLAARDRIPDQAVTDGDPAGDATTGERLEDQTEQHPTERPS